MRIEIYRQDPAPEQEDLFQHDNCENLIAYLKLENEGLKAHISYLTQLTKQVL